ncbi:MAG: dienelactone hydrolase family protein [Anaerolineae bacterium]|nr:dienelactone hydrolase family protein [Anaerolineae bacterium]
MRNTDYTLEWVRFKGRFPDMELGGYLATPINGPEKMPAVLSFDGNYGLNRPFGLEAELQPYLNAYADQLARAGYIIFVPYVNSGLVDPWAAVIEAKSAGRRTIWNYLAPLYMSGVDYLLGLPNVDPARVTAYGISYGGVAALVTTVVDKRVSALVYSNPLEELTLFSADPIAARSPVWQTSLCRYFDQMRSLLVAPRWFIWENGELDANQSSEYVTQIPDRVSSIYRAIGLSTRFRLARHSGGREPSWVTVPILSSFMQVPQ